MNYNTFITALGTLLSDLFKVWSYKSFGVLLAMCGVYMAIKIVKGMINV